MSITPSPIAGHRATTMGSGSATTPSPARSVTTTTTTASRNPFGGGTMSDASASRSRKQMSPMRLLARGASVLPPINVDFGGPLACEVAIRTPAHFVQHNLKNDEEDEEKQEEDGGAKVDAGQHSHAATDGDAPVAVVKTDFSEERQRWREGAANTPPKPKLHGRQKRRQAQLDAQQELLTPNKDDAQWEERQELVNARLYADFGPQCRIFRKLFLAEDARNRREAVNTTKAERRRETILVGRVPPPREQPPVPREVAEDFDADELLEIDRAQFGRTGFASPALKAAAAAAAAAALSAPASGRASPPGSPKVPALGMVTPFVQQRQHSFKFPSESASGSVPTTAKPTASTASMSKQRPSSFVSTKDATPPPRRRTTVLEGIGVFETEDEEEEEEHEEEQHQQHHHRQHHGEFSDDDDDVEYFDDDEEEEQNEGEEHARNAFKDAIHGNGDDDDDDDDDDDAAGAGAPAISRLPETYSASVNKLLRAVHLSRPENQTRGLARTMQKRGCERNVERRRRAEEHTRTDKPVEVPRRFQFHKSMQQQAMEDLNAISDSAYVDEVTDKAIFFRQAVASEKRDSADPTAAAIASSSSSSSKGPSPLISSYALRRAKHGSDSPQSPHQKLTRAIAEVVSQKNNADAAPRPMLRQRFADSAAALESKAASKAAAALTASPFAVPHKKVAHVAVGSTVELGGRMFVFDESMRAGKF